MASSSVKKVTLKSSDGEEFLVEDPVAMQSQLIRYMIEEGCADGVIPLYNVNSKILSKVIEYCKKAAAAGGGDEEAAEEDRRGWDSYFEKVDPASLFGLITAADYLNIKGLGDLIWQTMADMVRGKTPKEISQLFNKKNMTPKEKEEYRKKFPFLFFLGGDHIKENIEILTPEEQEEIRRAYEKHRRAYQKHRRAFGGEDRIEEKHHSVFDNKELLEKLREELRRAIEELISASDNEELRRTFEELMRASNIEEHRRALKKFKRAFNIEKLRFYDEFRQEFYIEEFRVKFLRAFDNEEIPQASDNEELRRAFEKLRRASNFEELRRAFKELQRAFEELRRASEIEEKRLLDHMFF